MPELVVVGGGPAGMAAALAASAAGVSVTLLDAASRLGGQIYRQPLRDADGSGAAIGPHLPARFAALRGAGVELLTGRAVWAVSSVPGGYELLLATPEGAGAGRLVAPALVLATGASELVLPFRGWELPGVTSAGAAQALLKHEGVLLGRRVVVAGSGPFLLPVAAALVRGGARVAAVVEAGDPLRRPQALARLGAAPRVVRDALSYLAVLAAARVPLLRGAAVTAAVGSERVEEVVVSRLDAQWRPRPGGERRYAVDAACVSFGFVPRLELARQLGLADHTAPGRPGAATRHDGGVTGLPGVFVAGELTGIGGAHLAELEGERAGTAAALHLGRRPARRARPAALARAGWVAAGLAALYPLAPGWLEWSDEATVVCRCEDVTVGALRGALEGGARSVRELRSVTRCGMGYCQGRTCGPIAQLLVAAATGRATAVVGDLHLRPVATPVALGALDAPPTAARDADPEAAGPSTVV